MTNLELARTRTEKISEIRGSLILLENLNRKQQFLEKKYKKVSSKPKFYKIYFENVRFCKLERNRNWFGPVLSDLVTFKNWYLENDFKKT